MTFVLKLKSTCVMNLNNQLVVNDASEVIIHSHLIHCENYLKKRLKLSDMIQIDWKLCREVVQRIPNYLHAWPIKIFLNFEGTAYTLYRKKLCNSNVYRCYLIEPELDDLHILDCKQIFL